MTNNVYATQADALEEGRRVQAIVDAIIQLMRQAEAARTLAFECERKAQRLVDSTPCWNGAFVSSDRNDVLVTDEGKIAVHRVKR